MCDGWADGHLCASARLANYSVVLAMAARSELVPLAEADPLEHWESPVASWGCLKPGSPSKEQEWSRDTGDCTCGDMRASLVSE
jgi:hypothetical protein